MKNFVASAGRLFRTFVASVGCRCYVGSCCFSWSSLLREIFVASIDCLRYVGLLLRQLVTSATWDLGLLHYVGPQSLPLYVGPMSSLDYVSFGPSFKEGKPSKSLISRPALEALDYNSRSCRQKMRRRGKSGRYREVNKAWKMAEKKTPMECSFVPFSMRTYRSYPSIVVLLIIYSA